MKKIIALGLACTVLYTAVPAQAETVRVNNTGGTGLESIVTSGGSITGEINIPTRASNVILVDGWSKEEYSVGYAFKGYYDSSGRMCIDASGRQIAEITGDSLYAAWEDTSFTLPTPVKAGYVFNGWATDANFSNLWFTPVIVNPSGILVLYKAFSPIVCQVTVEDEGSILDRQDVEYGKKLQSITKHVKKYAVRYQNCDFKDEEFSRKFLGCYDSNKVRYIDETGKGCRKWDKVLDTELTTLWENPNVTIATPVRDGYEFLGWSTTSGGTITKSIVNQKLNSDLTLIANWDGVKSTMSLDTGNETETVETKYGEQLPNVKIPTSFGYVFAGYYTEANGAGEQVYAANGTSKVISNHKEDFRLYAKWLKKEVNQTKNIECGKGETVSVNLLSECTNLSYDADRFKVKKAGNIVTVKALKTGKGTVSVECADGSLNKITVEAGKAPKTVEVKNSTITLRVGQKKKIKFSLDEDAVSNSIVYKSSRKRIATVSSSGRIRARAVGRCTVKIKTYNGKVGVIKVVVKKKVV